MSEKLEAFYADALSALGVIADKHGLNLPLGHACLEDGILHWRLSVYAQDPKQYWEHTWQANAQALGLGLLIEPGDVVLDQEGRSWTLLGLDPSAVNYPVRLLGATGEHHMASIEAATMFQLLVKRENQPTDA